MADQNIIRRTPDRLQGAENIASALANVMNFTLSQKIQQDRNRQALEAVAQEQQAKQALQQQENEAAFGRLQADLSFRNVTEQRLKEQQRAELDELIRHNKAIEGTKEKELNVEQDKARSLAALRVAQSKKYQTTLKEETLAKSIEERVKQLTALSDPALMETPGARMRAQMIVEELRPLQAELDKIRSGGAPSSDINQQILRSGKVGFRSYLRDTGLPIPPESFYQQAPDLNALDSLTTEPAATDTIPSLDEILFGK